MVIRILLKDHSDLFSEEDLLSELLLVGLESPPESLSEDFEVEVFARPPADLLA